MRRNRTEDGERKEEERDKGKWIEVGKERKKHYYNERSTIDVKEVNVESALPNEGH